MILCSTGAFLGRANGRDYTLLADISRKLDCDGFEFMMYDDWYEKADDIVRFFDGADKPFPVFHIEKGVGDMISRDAPGDSEMATELFEQNCQLAARLGSQKLVLHLWSGKDSDKYIPHNMVMYRQLREIAERYSLLLTVENVVCFFFDPMTHMRHLMEFFPDIAFTFDTKMAEFHGQTADIAKEENRAVWGKVAHLHVNDYKGGIKDWGSLATLHIGEGQVDFRSFFGFVKAMGYSGDITIESTSFDKEGMYLDKMAKSIQCVREYLK